MSEDSSRYMTYARHHESHTPRVVAVVVSFNRRDLLQQSLDALEAQDRPADCILVVDNCSTDDSIAVAQAHPAQPTVLELSRNTGGAGGFAAGIAYAVNTLNADIVWLMDDDTIPRPGALSEALKTFQFFEGSIGLVGSKVVWHDGREHPMNTPRVKPGASSELIARAASISAVPVRSSSFVSMFVSAERIREVGLPIADYFIWNDDFEYSLRLVRGRVGLASRTSEVLHLTKTFGATDADPGERFYYEVRNKVWLLRGSAGLSAPERVLYTGASIRRWIRTIARSSNKKLLLSVGWRGLKDGVRTSPRPTADVLAGLGAVSDAVAALTSTTETK